MKNQFFSLNLHACKFRSSLKNLSIPTALTTKKHISSLNVILIFFQLSKTVITGKKKQQENGSTDRNLLASHIEKPAWDK